MTLEEQRQQILAQVGAYAAQKEQRGIFVAGTSAVPPAGRVLDAESYVALVDAALDGWLTTGRFNDEFEKQIAARIGVSRALTVNSGSSANLLALSALTSPLLGERAIKPGDEVITAAAGFPTTINPILQNGLVPVFVDSALPTYNPGVENIAAAIGPSTRAIMLAHALGNPFEAVALRALADRHGLWLIEDCCDAFGATYQDRNVGTFGHLGTLRASPRAAQCSPMIPCLPGPPSPSATGVAIATVRRAGIIPAANALIGSWAICRAATTTNTPTRTPATTSRLPTCRRRWE